MSNLSEPFTVRHGLMLKSTADISSDQSALTLFNSGVTSANVLGDASTITLGALTGTLTIRNAAVSLRAITATSISSPSATFTALTTTGATSLGAVTATSITSSSVSATTSNFGTIVCNALVIDGNGTQAGVGITTATNIQTLTNKTLTAPIINNGSYDGRSIATTGAPNTIAARDLSGDVFARYLNVTAPNNENPAISQVFVSNSTDGYLRKSSLNSFSTALDQIQSVGRVISAATISGATFSSGSVSASTIVSSTINASSINASSITSPTITMGTMSTTSLSGCSITTSSITASNFSGNVASSVITLSSINSTAIGASAPSTGNFTTLTAQTISATNAVTGGGGTTAQSSTAVRGTILCADTAEVRALAINNKAVTPASLVGAFSGAGIASFTTNGYIRIPGGLVIQWGTFTSNPNSTTVTNFPIAFPNACLSAVVSSAAIGANSQDNTAATVSHTSTQLSSYSASDFSLPARFIAIGF